MLINCGGIYQSRLLSGVGEKIRGYKSLIEFLNSIGDSNNRRKEQLKAIVDTPLEVVDNGYSDTPRQKHWLSVCRQGLNSCR